MIVKIAGIAILSAISFVLLKKDKAEFAFVLELCSVAGILLLILPYFENIISMFSDISAFADISSGFMEILIKCCAIAIISKFICELCADAGENALCVKIEFAAKVLIMTQALPIVRALLDLILSLTEKLL